jgi:hypothetical protein
MRQTRPCKVGVKEGETIEQRALNKIAIQLRELKFKRKREQFSPLRISRRRQIVEICGFGRLTPLNINVGTSWI